MIKTFEQFIKESRDLELVTEIGTANVKGYRYKKPKKKFADIMFGEPLEVRFKTKSKLEYLVTLKPIGGFLEVDFQLENVEDEYQETNRGELFSIMSTVAGIVGEVLELNPEFKGIRYDAKSQNKKDKSDAGAKRDKLYTAYMSKHFKDAKMVKSGATTFFIFN